MQDTSAVTTLAITPSPVSPQDGGYLLTCGRSLGIHIYSLPSLALHRNVARAHDAPIITSCADPTGTLFATGSADGIVKVWDAANGHCTHVFKGHGGVVSAMAFDIASAGDGGRQGRARLVTGADDCKIRVWDLRTREGLYVLDGHVSVVRGLDVTRDGKTLVSGGRDKVLNVWDLERGVLRKTLPVFETIEAVGIVDVPEPGAAGDKKGKGKETGSTRRAVFTAGDKGVVRLWDLLTNEQIKTAADEVTKGGKVHEIVDVVCVSLPLALPPSSPRSLCGSRRLFSPSSDSSFLAGTRPSPPPSPPSTSTRTSSPARSPPSRRPARSSASTTRSSTPASSRLHPPHRHSTHQTRRPRPSPSRTSPSRPTRT